MILIILINFMAGAYHTFSPSSIHNFWQIHAFSLSYAHGIAAGLIYAESMVFLCNEILSA